MAVYNISFSPTGGTRKVSGILARGFDTESTEIDLLKRDQDVLEASGFFVYCRGIRSCRAFDYAPVCRQTAGCFG